MHRTLSVFLLVLLGSPVVLAASVPIAVSPGSVQQVVAIGSNCPTFSWAGVSNATAYELVVYPAGEDLPGGDTRPSLWRRLPATANSYTPELARCLEPGGRYAWSVRATMADTLSEWSQPSLFKVALRPNRVELEEALVVVRRYLAVKEDEDHDNPETGIKSEDKVLKADSESEAIAGSVLASAVQPTQLMVDGGVVAGSLTGDGSTLANLDPAAISAGTAAINIFGTATSAFALNADGSNCSPGQWAAGVDAGGNAQGCTVDGGIDHGFGSNNTRVGPGALASNTTGATNTATGWNALYGNTSGSDNTATGFEALYSNTIGTGNTATGRLALAGNTDGYFNTATGRGAMRHNTSGARNTAHGYATLYDNSTGAYNAAHGHGALRFNDTGSWNTGGGALALFNSTTGDGNTAVGFRAQFSNSTGHTNTAVGFRTLAANTAGNNNTAIGWRALRYNLGSDNTAIGVDAGYFANGSSITGSRRCS